MIKLTERFIASLVRQPESGMGYQIVEVEYISRGIKKGVVYNAEIIVFEDEPRRIITEAQYQELVKAASTETSLIKSISVIPPQAPLIKSASQISEEKPLGKPATEGEIEETEKDEIFKRFTAYRNDRRITAGGSLLPGTYATTGEDARNVKTGKEAVERYALPDPKPAIYRFTIEPEEDTKIKKGIVQPAYGHKGGGVEVIFVDGTTDNTVTSPDTIPGG